MLGTEDANALSGSAQADFLVGGGGNDTLTGGLGNDTLVGGSGSDTAIYSSLWRQYSLTGNPSSNASLSGPDGSDSLSGIEQLQFVDGALSAGVWAVNGNAASVARLYWGALGRAPEVGGAVHWTGVIENGQMSLAQEAAAFIGSLEFQSRYGNPDNAHFVHLLYQNVLGRAAEPAGLEYWTWTLDAGTSRADVLLGFTESAEGRARVGSLIDNGIVTDHAVLGTEDANALTGSAQADVLVGGGGNDNLTGGLGNDTLVGGSGQDSFRFDTLLDALGNRDTVSDFNVADDTLELDHAVFATLPPGILAAASFRAGPGITSAADADDWLIYDSSSGALYYDADGSGGGTAVQFATLASELALSNVDFLVV